MEKNKVLRIEPIDMPRKKGYYFFNSFCIAAIVTIFFILVGKGGSRNGIIILFAVCFFSMYLSSIIAPIRKGWNFMMWGIGINKEKITFYRGINAPPKTIFRSSIADCKLEIQSEKPLRKTIRAGLSGKPKSFFETSKKLIMLDDNGKKIYIINAALYKDEAIEKLISLFQRKSS